MFVLFQLLFTCVCLPGCTLMRPYFFMTVQNGAHTVCLDAFPSCFLSFGLLFRVIVCSPQLRIRPARILLVVLRRVLCVRELLLVLQALLLRVVGVRCE